jgi:hypothetical protein
MGSICLASLEVEPVKLKEENANHKRRPLVAIDKRMITDDAGCVQGSHFDNIRCVGIGMVLARPRKSRLQKAPVSQPGGAAVVRQ